MPLKDGLISFVGVTDLHPNTTPKSHSISATRSRLQGKQRRAVVSPGESFFPIQAGAIFRLKGSILLT